MRVAYGMSHGNGARKHDDSGKNRLVGGWACRRANYVADSWNQHSMPYIGIELVTCTRSLNSQNGHWILHVAWRWIQKWCPNVIRRTPFSTLNIFARRYPISFKFSLAETARSQFVETLYAIR